MESDAIITQLVQYENDAVNVVYSDGAQLELSPCGAAFLYTESPQRGAHPLHGHKEIHQRTEFITSAFRHLVQEAVQFRNQFAERPYVCENLLETIDIVKFHRDIFEVGWPEQVQSADIQVLTDNSVRCTSVDDFASVTLSPSREQITVHYLCKVSQQRQKGSSKSKYKIRSSFPENDTVLTELPSTIKPDDSTFNKAYHETSYDNTLNSALPDIVPTNTLHCENSYVGESQTANRDIMNIDDNSKWHYSWITQNFSTLNIPKFIEHAYKLLMQYCKVELGESGTPLEKYSSYEKSSPVNNICYTNTDACDKNSDTKDGIVVLDKNTCKSRVYTGIPKALSVNCLSSHLHKWNKNGMNDESGGAPSYGANGRLKVICVGGIIYRFLWTPSVVLEIYPGDGSVLRSSGLSGQYFMHCVTAQKQAEQRMYSVSAPPPRVPSIPYDISSLIQRGSRLFQTVYTESIHTSISHPDTCWVEKSETPIVKPPPIEILEQCVVEDVGKFTAYSNGRINIVFSDRTMLNCEADLSQRLGHCAQHSQHSVVNQKKSHLKKRCPYDDVQDGSFCLLLPNGQYQYVKDDSPCSQFHSYISKAIEWIKWVNSTPGERFEYYKDTIHDEEKVKSVDRELQKINCFNFIVENTVLSSHKGSTAPTASSAYTTREVSSSSAPFDLRSVQNTTTSSAISYTQKSPFYGSGLLNPQTSPVTASDVGFDLRAVQEALNRTSQAVQDIDSFLGTKPGSENL